MEGQAWAWVEDPVVAMTDSGDVAREGPVVRFKTMTSGQLLEAAKTRLPRPEVLALLSEGYLRGMLNASGEARLSELLREDEEARQEGQEAARFRARHAGMDREEVAAMLREGGAR